MNSIGNKTNYYCTLCRLQGHTISRCRIFSKAKEIIKSYEKRKNVNYAQIANEDIDDERLDSIKTKFMEDIDWSDGPNNRSLIINNLRVDPNIYSEIIQTRCQIMNQETLAVKNTGQQTKVIKAITTYMMKTRKIKRGTNDNKDHILTTYGCTLSPIGGLVY